LKVIYHLWNGASSLSDLRGHSPFVSLFKWHFSSICATIDKISTDVARSLCDSYNNGLFDLAATAGLVTKSTYVHIEPK